MKQLIAGFIAIMILVSSSVCTLAEGINYTLLTDTELSDIIIAASDELRHRRQEPIAIDMSNLTERVLIGDFFDSKLQVYLIPYTKPYGFDNLFQLLAINNDNQKRRIFCEDVVINGWTITQTLYSGISDVVKGTKSMGNASFDSKYISKYIYDRTDISDLKDIETISFILEVTDADYDNRVYSDTITLKIK